MEKPKMNSFVPQEILIPGDNWFHPATAQLSPSLHILTAQQIKGSDCYANPVFTLSYDNGKSWNPVEEIPPFAAEERENGLQIGVADVRPFSLRDGACAVFGCTSFYTAAGNLFWHPQKGIGTLPPSKAVYAIRRSDGSWSPRGELLPPLETSDCRATCTQIVQLPDDELLIPIHFEAGHCLFGSRSSPRFASATIRAKRQGDKIECQELGTILKHEIGRGFIEPSMIALPDGTFALTLRAEDGCGYCSVSADGLHWDQPVPWHWDDGTPLVMSSTQQHWFRLGEKVYLAYTRRDETNEKVIRYRAPLYLAEAQAQTATLFRESEKVVFPRCIYNEEEVLYGNFHAANFSLETAVITDAALAPSSKKSKLWMAKIIL